jgi:regulator of sirC expression with transglutaminase-like and TPR domain
MAFCAGVKAIPRRFEIRRLDSCAMSNEIAALIGLLNDDRSVATAVRKRLLDLGEAALPALRAAEDRDDPRLRLRARQVRMVLERRATFRKLMALAESNDPDLETGVLHLASTHTPQLDHAEVRAKLDATADELRGAVEEGNTPQLRLLAFLSGVHRVLGFAGDREDFYNYDNNFVHTVIERRRGIPISIILIYILLGKRLGLEFRAVGTPQRALAWHRNEAYSTYIDAFDAGKLMTRDDCIAFLKRQGVAGTNYDNMLQLLTDRGVLERMSQNLINYSEAKGRHEECEHFRRLARALFDYRNRDGVVTKSREAQAE